MQGLRSGAIALAGTPLQQARYLPAVARGEKIAAFALSEAEAGSDVAALQTRATLVEGDGVWTAAKPGSATAASRISIVCSPRRILRPALGA